MRRRLLLEPLDERRVLAAITGAVFEDANLSFRRDADEAVAPRRLVFLDTNQNEQLDAGEPVSLAQDDGTFRFDDLADGTYLLRLFNGTSTQVQTTPVEASLGGTIVAVDNAVQLETVGTGFLALTSQAIVMGDLSSGTSEVIPLGDHLVRMQSLPDGRALVIGNDPAGPTSWLVDPVARTASQVDFNGSAGSLPWAELAIDGEGRGVLLEQSGESAALRAVDASSFGVDVRVEATSTIVPADTQVLTSVSGNRSVLAWNSLEGLELSLWSNATASPISVEPTEVADAMELLAFDDDSGLLAVRTLGGGVRIHDVDADFATLHSWAQLTGPVAIDGARELLVTISPDEPMLKMYSLRDGELLADLAIDLSGVGAVTSLSMPDPRSVVVLGAAGIAEIALRRPSAHRVKISQGQDPDPVLFGVLLSGTNTAPAYAALPTFATQEDVALILSASAALQGSADAEGDRYVVLQRTAAGQGTLVVQVDGAISYDPDADFNGDDSVNVMLHDGRDASSEVALNLTVHPVPDSPTEIRVQIDPIPENLQPGSVVGEIEIADADGMEQLQIELLDPRFEVNGNQIVFVGGELDLQAEPAISMGVKVTDNETGEQIESTGTIAVTKSNHPIREIWPDKAYVTENDAGGFVTFLGVDDGDDDQPIVLSVNDDRFEVIGKKLKLAPGIALDFETESVVVVEITATEQVRNGNSLTETLTIHVANLNEKPDYLALSNDLVMEKSPGAVVGEVLIGGAGPVSRFEFSVDDPRFEIVAGTLKLLDDQFVEHAAQSEIELEITARDYQGALETISESFLIYVMENESPHHNHEDPYDVDHNGRITSLDALAIINYLNVYGPGPVGPADIGYCYDVNDDAMVTALDALLVLNEINRRQIRDETVGSGEGSGQGEGEQTPIPTSSTPTSAPLEPPRAQSEPLNSQQGSVPSQAPLRDDLFGQWGSDSGALSDETRSSLAPPSQPADDDVGDRSAETFADSVDQTLRLLSDDLS